MKNITKEDILEYLESMNDHLQYAGDEIVESYEYEDREDAFENSELYRGAVAVENAFSNELFLETLASMIYMASTLNSF